MVRYYYTMTSWLANQRFKFGIQKKKINTRISAMSRREEGECFARWIRGSKRLYCSIKLLIEVAVLDMGVYLVEGCLLGMGVEVRGQK